MELLHMPNPHEWDPAAEDWNLPENWEKFSVTPLPTGWRSTAR